MGGRKMELVLVRNSGPVTSMSLGSWFIKFFALVMALLLVGLGVGGYFFYRQHQAFQVMTDEVRLLALRAERLEALVQEQETVALMATQHEQSGQEAEEKPQRPQAAAATAPARPAAEPEKAAEASQAAQTAQQAAVASAASGGAAKPAANPAEAALQPAATPPTAADWVAMRNVVQKAQGNELVVNFEVTNTGEGGEPAEGYVVLVLKGSRQGKPWMEAWPPMRLSPLGRPLNYRRGAPFSVMRYRRIRAKFAAVDKDLDLLEFLVYSRDGDLVLVERQPVAVGKTGMVEGGGGARPGGGEA